MKPSTVRGLRDRLSLTPKSRLDGKGVQEILNALDEHLAAGPPPPPGTVVVDQATLEELQALAQGEDAEASLLADWDHRR